MFFGVVGESPFGFSEGFREAVIPLSFVDEAGATLAPFALAHANSPRKAIRPWAFFWAVRCASNAWNGVGREASSSIEASP